MLDLRVVSLSFLLLLLDAPYTCTALCYFGKLGRLTAFSSSRSRPNDQISAFTALHQTQSNNNDDAVKRNVNSKKQLVYKHISLLIAIWQKIHALAQISYSDSDAVDDDDDDYSDFILSEYYGANSNSPDIKSSKNRKLVDGVIKHFQFCKDTCAADGAFLMATQNSADQDLLRLSRVRLQLQTTVKPHL